MTQIDSKDRQILHFIAVKEEVFFKELEGAQMMAKSTLSKHLGELVKIGLLRKTISKTRSIGPHCVTYVATSKGKKALLEQRDIKYLNLKDF